MSAPADVHPRWAQDHARPLLGALTAEAEAKDALSVEIPLPLAWALLTAIGEPLPPDDD